MNCHNICLALNPEGVALLEATLQEADLRAFFDECEDREEDREGCRLYEWQCVGWRANGTFARWIKTLPASTFTCIRVNENNYRDVDWQGNFQPNPFALTLRQYIDFE